MLSLSVTRSLAGTGTSTAITALEITSDNDYINEADDANCTRKRQAVCVLFFTTSATSLVNNCFSVSSEQPQVKGIRTEIVVVSGEVII